MSSMIRTYSELMEISTFKERYQYLSLNGVVGKETFGFDRYINQQFYTSTEWRQLRHKIIVRDNGCDLGFDDYEIRSGIVIHHMNPMQLIDITRGDQKTLDPEFLISTQHQTHMAIHYGDERLLPRIFVDRSPGDTKLW